MKKELVLGAAANISHMVKVGDHVKTGDALVVFEEVPNDPDMAMFLDKLGADLGEEIQKDSKNYLKSKYTGTIEDIKIYYTVPEEELSPSLRKVITDYNNRINAKKALLNKYYKDGNDSDIILPPSEMINTPDGKVKGVAVGEGVLIEFYIKYADELGRFCLV